MNDPQQLDIEAAIRATMPQTKTQRYESKMRRAGFVAVKVWVPAHRKEQMLRLSERLRAEPDLEIEERHSSIPPG